MDLYELLCHTPCPQQREAAEILQEMRVHRTQEEGGREKKDLISAYGPVLLRTTDLVKHLLEGRLDLQTQRPVMPWEVRVIEYLIQY